MKRKALSVFSLLLALLLVLGMTACNEAPASPCTEHAWHEASCTLPKICTVCGTTEGTVDETAHAWTLTGQTPAECLTDGEACYTCALCGDVLVQPLPACGHTVVTDECTACGRVGLNDIKNLVYIIGDGMGMEHIAAGQYAGGKTYAFPKWQFASVNTDSLTPGGKNASNLTDSAAAGTALATGTLTLNSYVGKDQNGNDLQTLLDIAKADGKKTGIITTDNLYGATPGAFSAHTTDRNQSMEILLSQLNTSNVDFLCGAYNDTYNLPAETITEKGYRFCQTMAEIYDDASIGKRLYCTLDMEGFSSSASPIRLCNVTNAALGLLDCDEGFVLMIEQAHIDKYSHNNDFAKMVKAVESLNDTVNTVLEWIGDRTDTAIIITADHETGGLSVSRSKTLPYTHTVAGGSTVYYRFTATSHTNSDVGFFLWGAKVNLKTHSYFNTPYQLKNIDVFNIALQLIQNKR